MCSMISFYWRTVYIIDLQIGLTTPLLPSCSCKISIGITFGELAKKDLLWPNCLL